MFIIHFILHIDLYLQSFIAHYGNWVYVLAFGIIFAETGLVFLPILPGDSLLFTLGALAGKTTLNLWVVLLLMFLAAFIGNQINFYIGRFLGHKLVNGTRTMINKKHYHQAHQFYLDHGSTTIIAGRFFPIIRTFVPFVAGMAEMPMVKFVVVNIISAALWVGVITSIGYLFGNNIVIKQHFSMAIIVILILSVVAPLLLKNYLKRRSMK